MRSDKIADAMGLIRDSYIEEAHSVRVSRRPGRAVYGFGTSAACICLAVAVCFGLWGGVQLHESAASQTAGSADDDVPVIGERQPLTGDSDMSGDEVNTGDSVIFADTDFYEGALEGYTSIGASGLDISLLMSQTLDEAEDDNLIAAAVFVLDTGNYGYVWESASQLEIQWDESLRVALEKEQEHKRAELEELEREREKLIAQLEAQANELRHQYAAAEEMLTATEQKIIHELSTVYGMDLTEASAEKFSDERFTSARETARGAREKLELTLARLYYEKGASALQYLTDRGFRLLYDGRDSEYALYLSNLTAAGVIVGTKAQILSLADDGLPYEIRLHAASEKAAEYELKDFYSGSEPE